LPIEVRAEDRFRRALTAVPPIVVAKSPLELGKHIEIWFLVVESVIKLQKLPRYFKSYC
jgi:hypothetical protein